MTGASYKPEELLITTFARLLLGVEGLGHVAVGALSPIPGSASATACASSRAPARMSGWYLPTILANRPSATCQASAWASRVEMS